MSTDAPAGGGMPASGAAPDIAEIRKFISEEVGKAVHARVSRSEEKLAEIVKGEMSALKESLRGERKEPKPEEGEADKQEKLTLKALQDQVAKLNQGIEAERKKSEAAEQRARETRLRAEVHNHFARHLGADSPHLGPYVAHYLSQFVDKDGAIVRKVVDSYDQEQFAPASNAVDELFKGELKHLVQHSRAGQLPPGGRPRTNGNPVPSQQSQPGTPFFMQAVYEEIGKDRPELAERLISQANSTPQK